jgi:hypothetical protein
MCSCLREWVPGTRARVSGNSSTTRVPDGMILNLVNVFTVSSVYLTSVHSVGNRLRLYLNVLVAFPAVSPRLKGPVLRNWVQPYIHFV